MSQVNDDKLWMGYAKAVSTLSPDRSRKVGCALVRNGELVSDGFNTFPRGIQDKDCRHDRPAKYMWIEHAERNAVYSAAARGVKTQGCTAYVPWYPCVDCARALIQSGCVALVCKEPDFSDPKWGNDFRVVQEMLSEVEGFEVRYVND